MPKLNKELATKTDEAASTGYSPVPDGPYDVVLRGVEVKEGAKGPYWSWEFEIPEGDEFAGRRFWANTSLSEAALWKLNETFSAFGVSSDTDTDELVGKKVRAIISTRTIQAGARAGEETNQIESLQTSDAATAKSSKKADLPNF